MKFGKKSWNKVFIYGVIVSILVLFVFPIYWMFLSSFRENSVLMSLPPKFLPFGGSLANYIKILSIPKYIGFFRNSVIVSGGTMVVCMFTAIFAGYSLSRFSFKGKQLVMTAVLSIQMFPIVAILIPLYTFYSSMGLINTYQGLILADTTMALPLSIWLLKAFFDTVPKSLDEAANIDGCGRIKTLFVILVPLLKPGFVAVGIYTFLHSWDDYLFGLIIMNRDELKTLPVGIAQSFIGEFVHDYSGMMTMAVVASLPILIAFIFLQRYMIAGLTGGAVKG